VTAALLITVRQGAWLRRQLNPSATLKTVLERMLELLGADVEVIREDRRLEPDLRLLIERIHARTWKLYDESL
jgi:histidine ammonia-lyase